jgi:hypothetical protein
MPRIRHHEASIEARIPVSRSGHRPRMDVMARIWPTGASQAISDSVRHPGKRERFHQIQSPPAADTESWRSFVPLLAFSLGRKIHQTTPPPLSPAGVFAYDFGANTKPRTKSGHRTVVGRSVPRSSGRHFRAQRGWRISGGNPTFRSIPTPTRMLTALSPMVCSFDHRH